MLLDKKSIILLLPYLVLRAGGAVEVTVERGRAVFALPSQRAPGPYGVVSDLGLLSLKRTQGRLHTVTSKMDEGCVLGRRDSDLAEGDAMN